MDNKNQIIEELIDICIKYDMPAEDAPFVRKAAGVIIDIRDCLDRIARALETK